MFIKSKPAKYGIKVWVLCDSETAYCGNAQVYTGKVGNIPEKGQGSRVVKDLASYIYESGRNITMDNFFTDAELAEYLLMRNLTTVGTLRKNKACIPDELLAARREVHSSIFVFSGDITLTSYVPKLNKSVVLLSTMHHDDTVDASRDNKPDMILFYNATKGGVDSLDKMCRQYSCKRSTRRWPLSLFFSIIDIIMHNSSVIWFAHHPDWMNNASDRHPSSRRRVFLQEAGIAMCWPWILSRRADQRIAQQESMKRCFLALGIPLDPKAAPDSEKQRGRCISCPRKKEQKVTNRCRQCKQFVCGKHALKSYECKSCDNK